MENFGLVYYGENISDGMDLRTFLSAVQGFERYVNSANSLANPTSDRLQMKMYRISEGSLSLELICETLSDTQSTLGAIASISQLLVEGINLTKHLAGFKPANVENGRNGTVEITNNHGDVAVYNINAQNLVLNLGGANDVERFIGQPLQKEANVFDFLSQKKKLLSITRKESLKIKPLSVAESLISHEYEQWLMLVRPVLEGIGKWHFSDGTRRFFASIEDKEFLQQVHDGFISFSNGDEIFALLRAEQVREGGKLSARYSITKVINHRRRGLDQTAML